MSINNNNRKEIGERLKEFRKKYKLSQRNVAEAIGITQASYSSIETGSTKKISKSNLKLLETALNMNIAWLLTGDGEMKVKENTDRPFSAGNEYPFLLREHLSNITLEYNEYRKLIDLIAAQQNSISTLQEIIKLFAQGKNGIAGAV